MKKSCLILLIVTHSLATAVFAAAPPLKDWQKCMGGSLQDIPGSILRLNDGNVIVLSNVDSHDGDISFNHGSTDIWLSKIDSAGNILWKKSIGGSSIDIGTDISELPNGNLIISGYTSSTDGDIPTNKGNFDALLICLDNTGQIRWTRVYGGSKVDLTYSHAQTADGGFILGGGTYSGDDDVSFNHGDQDFWILKTDSSGNLLWEETSGGNDVDVCYSLTKDGNGNIYACGTTNSTNGSFSNHGSYDVYVVRCNQNGNVIWNKTYGGSNYETAQSIIVDSRQNIVLGGYTRSSDGDVHSNYGYGDSWVLQLNGSGTIIREKTFGGTGGDDLFSIIETMDGGYLLTSGSTSNNIDIKNALGQEDIWLLKTDASLAKEWSYNYGGSGNDRPVDVLQNADGGFLVTGYTFSSDLDVTGQHGTGDIWLLNLTCKVPSAFFSSDPEVCLGDIITLLDSSTYSSQANWFLNNVVYSYGDSAQLNFTSAGYYQVGLNVQTCYYSSDYFNSITVRDCNLPVVNFNAQTTSVCANGQVTFNDASTGANTWQWLFPGGTPSTSALRNPVISYSQPGVYNVMLTVTNNHGTQTAMKLNYITVHALPAVPVITIQGNELISTTATSYQWFLNNAPLPNAVSQSLVAQSTGFYQVMTEDNHHCSNISESIFYSPTGIEEESISEKLTVYPNPANNKLNVIVPDNSEGRLFLINMKGQKLMEREIVKTDTKVIFNQLQYPGGIYKVLLVQDSGKIIQQTIIIN